MAFRDHSQGHSVTAASRITCEWVEFCVPSWVRSEIQALRPLCHT
jgi:hypothetical protein